MSDDEAATARTVLEGSEAELRRLLTGAGVVEQDLDAGLRAFDDLAAADAERRAAGVARAGMVGRLEQLLAGRTIEQLRDEARAARTSLTAHVDRLGDLSLPRESRVDIDELRRLRLDAVERAAGVAARREEREASLADIADFELRLDAARREFEALDLKARAVRIARQELAAAASDAHRRVAPHLNAALRRSLPVITRGRYRDAMVADDLSIRVMAPGAPEPVEVERLSRGTRDQIALVQRLELARLMDPTGGGSPLLLDDCFAHTYLTRLPIAAGLLARVARHRQVVLFSDDPDVVAAVVDTAVDALVIQLPDPVVDASVLDVALPAGG